MSLGHSGHFSSTHANESKFSWMPANTTIQRDDEKDEHEPEQQAV